jgi:hypothetical protein
VLRLEQQKRQAAEMIAVEMAEEHPVDGRGLDAEAAHGDERGGAAVDQEALAAGGHEEAGLQTAAAAERVAAAQHPDRHPGHCPSRFACSRFFFGQRRLRRL